MVDASVFYDHTCVGRLVIVKYGNMHFICELILMQYCHLFTVFKHLQFSIVLCQ